MSGNPSIGAVLIGRNEGQRLIRSLASVAGIRRVVYVDSGSTDGSVAAARAAGVEVVELDLATPFTAARARDAGVARLRADGLPDMIQFIDGDCELHPGWITAARGAFERDESLGVVTGWRSEQFPEASVYNAICDTEWHRPAGPIRTCGGDMMVRAAAYEQVGGFNPRVIAAEDDDFCLRVGQAGWGLLRLPLPMTRHDAAMTSFAQWWRRAVRAGHGYAQVGALHPGHFRRERARVLAWGAALPLAMLLGIVVLGGWSLALGLALYALSWLRSIRGLRREGLGRSDAARQAAFLTLSKFPNLQGMLTYYWRALRDREMRIIEYK
ncbi:glycosyl transferase [Defluviimonas sp. 20V17]|uniref:Glycosyltransferase, GT2 family n=1 Tax=Allgaiera indica TaxID=765699 RepID=A0AAN4UNR6_9RHOB|nr:glycosyltransferase [Allgaiera indica]KDB02995.1 glycosyl transferase [Defluviimonas sp. 20V17]GHD98601.1 hypothetical protein GCM10008024_02770 [Allgaiera indica]SDW10078.1 Glycosyltransferase, GT2 family [Allgaiera indica]